MNIWLVIRTDGGRDETRGKVFTRPTEARLSLREAAARLYECGKNGRKLTVDVSDEPDESGWHEFVIESTSGDSVKLCAAHVVGSSYDWPLQPGQILFAERMLKEVVAEVTQ